ncbi:MAG: hypothetical protein JST26_05500 [Bacteroidetes bacterium]|nr:hypothetical protein [Bacteroidota bacterium]
METLTLIITSIQNYVASLDWSYILTFIILCYGINHYKVKEGLQKATGTQTRTRYRVILIGLVYGVILYFLRGYTIAHIENLFQSFVFALVFHKFMIESFLYWMAKHGLPESIGKHVLDAEQLKKLTDHENK